MSSVFISREAILRLEKVSAVVLNCYVQQIQLHLIYTPFVFTLNGVQNTKILVALLYYFYSPKL